MEPPSYQTQAYNKNGDAHIPMQDICQQFLERADLLQKCYISPSEFKEYLKFLVSLEYETGDA